MTISINTYREAIEKALQSYNYGEAPKELYDPIRYIITLGGKRLRPLTTLLAYRLFKEDFEEAVQPAIAVEVFHNFTLMHDDIMDNAPLRRGKTTVHEKWNENIAILSGDVMLVKAYEILQACPADKLPEVLRAFNKCASEVCEGQQYDLNFETRQVVSIAEYLEMIKLKTAVLLGFSLELGAILGGASNENRNKLKEAGILIGIGFQLKDDYLDVYGDTKKFGKQVGGDIIANKKTYLLIKALEDAEGDDKTLLEEWIKKDVPFDANEKVKAVTTIYNQLGIGEATNNRIQEYFQKGLSLLEEVDADPESKTLLIGFVNELINREN